MNTLAELKALDTSTWFNEANPEFAEAHYASLPVHQGPTGEPVGKEPAAASVMVITPAVSLAPPGR
ncbi:hypothetical protein [Halomonas sp. 141]|uniref:hypothetical protein n=1 Tax=Halomonas sp. 141 TaxID=2056666 RepID=UPI0012FD7821|nr:hypothetical protein [Halomonas sp. 141]